ncbi:NADP-dependent oxidoreductase [Streptomyces sp. BE147]|uniref:MDR family NADP-dependent oxidoreductase n=1 Tax=Streptomyces sp. BE147 TaxID=3002524 RepID=UPI002E761986|nr:NADP-dependent oxidoreductase [Streptomyces sp. BE147]MEE1738307.1 NADP-dependent oxidoreductase [Streptomyces sp. BE147]
MPADQPILPAQPPATDTPHDSGSPQDRPAPHASAASPVARTSREVRLVSVPEGLPRPEHFRVAEAAIPRLGAGEVLVRNRYFQVFPALRTVIAGGVEGAPFPGIRPGDALFGAAVGEVVATGAGEGNGQEEPGGHGATAGVPRIGAWVSHWLGWREYAVVPAGGYTLLGDELPDPAAHLSEGPLAYAALTQGAGLRSGETVFVSGGAGAVGSMAGQLAGLLGAGRVIGSTGSAEKAHRMTESLGYDAVVLREPGASFAARLAEAAPDGIDVFIDLVGGEQLRAAVTVARPGARFVLVGALSGQLAEGSRGDSAPAEIDFFEVIVKRITMRGFGGLDLQETRSQWDREFGRWLRSGRITFPHVRVQGMENAARALHEVIGGRHFGMVVVEV